MKYLSNKRGNPDRIINRIGKESNENIALPMYFPSVDFIEYCHHNKRVKDHGEMNRRWGCQVGIFTIINVEYYITWKNNWNVFFFSLEEKINTIKLYFQGGK